MESTYLIDQYVNVKPGEAYRLLPFGQIIKNGKRRDITPEIAARFKLPHFKPPIKLGSHDDKTPAGGSIVALEVRPDGLYGIPELTDKGAQTLAEGDYRYHSPEVIWEGGGYEDPQTGELIEGPLIVGDALLHTPHLGERAALFEVTPFTRSETMEEQSVTIPTSLWAKAMAKLFPDPEQMADPKPEPTPEQEGVKPEEFQAAVAERDEYKAKFEEMQAKQERQAQFDKFNAELKDTKLEGVENGPEILAAMTAEQADWVLAQFKALSAQVAANDKITEEMGNDGENTTPDDPKEALNAAVLAKVKELKVTYNAAMEVVAKETPELVKAAGYTK